MLAQKKESHGVVALRHDCDGEMGAARYPVTLVRLQDACCALRTVAQLDKDMRSV